MCVCWMGVSVGGAWVCVCVCVCVHIIRGAKQGGVSTPPEFWMEGLNTCQPPLILRKKKLGGLAPLKLI